MACVVGADGMSGLVYAIKLGTVVTCGINAHVRDDWELALWTVAVGGLAEQDGNNCECSCTFCDGTPTLGCGTTVMLLAESLIVELKAVIGQNRFAKPSGEKVLPLLAASCRPAPLSCVIIDAAI
jgi:hypothetical protein